MNTERTALEIAKESTDDSAIRASWIEWSKMYYSPTFGQGFRSGLVYAREQVAVQLEEAADRWQLLSEEVYNALRDQAVKIRGKENETNKP